MAERAPGAPAAPTTRDLIQSLYGALRSQARERLRGERRGHTLGPTALVHEVFLRLDSSQAWPTEQEFLAAAAVTARRVLVDRARRRGAAKRTPGVPRAAHAEPPDARCWTQLVEIDEAITRLSELDPRRGRVAELRLFGGLTGEEIASVLTLSRNTVTQDWSAARAWLARELKGEAP